MLVLMRTYPRVAVPAMALRCTVGIPGGVVAYCCAAGREGDGILSLHTLRERDGVWRFQRTPGPSLTTEGGHRRHVISCQTALDASQGVKVPFLVTRTRKSSSEVEILALSGLGSCNTQLTHCGILPMEERYASARESDLNILNGADSCVE